MFLSLFTVPDIFYFFYKCVISIVNYYLFLVQISEPYHYNKNHIVPLLFLFANCTVQKFSTVQFANKTNITLLCLVTKHKSVFRFMVKKREPYRNKNKSVFHFQFFNFNFVENYSQIITVKITLLTWRRDSSVM